MSEFNPGGPINNLQPQTIETELSVQVRNQLTRLSTLKTGQTTSYATGDDGALQYGRAADFFTLYVNGPLDGTTRWTNDMGGTVFDGSDGSTANYAVDNETGLGWCITVQSPAVWATAISIANVFSGIGSYTGWFLPNINQLISIINFGLTQALSYVPFNYTASVNIWSGSTYHASSSSAFRLANNTFNIGPSAKTSIYNFFVCRKHFAIP